MRESKMSAFNKKERVEEYCKSNGYYCEWIIKKHTHGCTHLVLKKHVVVGRIQRVVGRPRTATVQR
jgi:hypothetical protein